MYGRCCSEPISTIRPSNPSLRKVSTARPPAKPAPTITKVSAAAISSSPADSGRIYGCQLGERKRADQKAEVAQRDVPVLTLADQVDDNPGEPECNEIPTKSGCNRHHEPRHDLDHAHDVHDRLGAPRQSVGEERR